MAKLTLLLAFVTLGLFGSTKSASFECGFNTGDWETLGSVYYCRVQNSVSITSTDATQIDSISGTHEAGYNNDNVEAIRVFNKGQIHYFPTGLDKIFKNLKGIYFAGTGLKEIHQSDLKVFPDLRSLFLHANNLEILEENLFEFNPNLELINLYHNKISHIDPNVFDKLTKLKILYLDSNTCIEMDAYKNPTAVQNVIRTVKSQCINSEYSLLNQKVKNLEAESKNLNSEKFKEKLENLENEVKNLKYQNFFQGKFEGLKSAQILKAQEEASTTTTTTQKPTTQPPPTTTVATTTAKSIKFETCSALEAKVDQIAADVKDLMNQITNKAENNQCTDNFSEHLVDLDEKFTKIGENLASFKAKMDGKIEEINAKLEEIGRKFEEKLEKLMKNVENGE